MLLKGDILFAPNGEKNNAILVFLWIAYALVTAFLISNHTPWRDEAYVWLVSREVSWLDIYRLTGDDSAPCLWYYILAVPAKVGLPYGSMQVVHWAGACFAAWIFLFKAPFSTLLKAVFIFSFYIAYEHAVVARVYMPTLLLMWSACWCYAKRYQRSILYGFVIALLANASFFGLFASIFLWIEFLRFPEGTPKLKQSGAMAIMSLAILLSVFSLVPNKDYWVFYVNDLNLFQLQNIHNVFYFSYLAPKSEYFFSGGIKAMLWAIAPWLSALYGILTLWLLKRWKAYGPMVFLILGWLVIIYLAVFKYSWAGPKHFSFCLMYTIMVLWMGKVRYGAAKTVMESVIGILFVVAFLLGILGTIVQGYYDLQLPYSGAKRLADYLIEHKLDNKIFLTSQPVIAASILPYIPQACLLDSENSKVVRYIESKGLGSQAFMIPRIPSDMKRKFYPFGPIYLIVTGEYIGTEVPKRFQLLYVAHGQVETFQLYLVPPPKKNGDPGLGIGSLFIHDLSIEKRLHFLR